MSGRPVARLLSLLTQLIGRESANQEFKWMKQAINNGPNTCLEVMLERRIRGEPLQYILGGCIYIMVFDELIIMGYKEHNRLDLLILLHEHLFSYLVQRQKTGSPDSRIYSTLLPKDRCRPWTFALAQVVSLYFCALSGSKEA